MWRSVPGNENFLCRQRNARAASLLSPYDTIAVLFFNCTSASPYSANAQSTSVFVITFGIPETKSLSSWYPPFHTSSVETSCFFGAIGTDTFSFVPSALKTELVNAFKASSWDQNVTKPLPYFSVSETELVTAYGTREGGKWCKEFNQYLGSSISFAVHNCVLHLSKLCKNLS